MDIEFFTVIGAGARTGASSYRYKRHVHSFDAYPTAKRYRTLLSHKYADTKFRIVHTVISAATGDVFSEIVSVAEEDLQ